MQSVPVIRRGNDHRIHIVAVEQLAEVVVRRGLAADLLLGRGQIGVVDVTQSDDLAIGVRQEGVEKLIPAVTNADAAEPDALIGPKDTRDGSRAEGG